MAQQKVIYYFLSRLKMLHSPSNSEWRWRRLSMSSGAIRTPRHLPSAGPACCCPTTARLTKARGASRRTRMPSMVPSAGHATTTPVSPSASMASRSVSSARPAQTAVLPTSRSMSQYITKGARRRPRRSRSASSMVTSRWAGPRSSPRAGSGRRASR